jgi:capsular exopolysaccharide synthesis family protein
MTNSPKVVSLRFIRNKTQGVFIKMPSTLDSPTHSETLWQDYIDVILSRIWVVAAVFGTVMVIAAGYVLTRPSAYMAYATVAIGEKNYRFQHRENVYNFPEWDQFTRYLNTHVEILKSRSSAENLVDRFDLVNHPEFASTSSWSLVGALSSWFSGDPDSDGTESEVTLRRNSVVGDVMGRVSVKPVKQSNLLQIGMEARSGQASAELLRKYIEVYLDRHLQERREESKETAAWLKDELDKSAQRLRRTQVALLDFTINNGIVDSKDGGLGEVFGLLHKKMEGAIKAQESLAKVQALKEQDPSEEHSVLLPRDLSNNEYVGRLKQELAILESEYTQMRGVYSSSYPKLKLLQKKIQFLTDRIHAMEKSMVVAALSTAKREESLLQDSYDSAKKEAGRIRSLEAGYSALKKEVDTNTEFQLTLLKEYKEMDIRARTISNDVKIVDSPTVPTVPSRPKTGLTLLVGSFLALTLGLAAAFAAERLDNTVKSPGEIQEYLGVRHLGVVPDASKLLETRHDTLKASVPYEFQSYKNPRSPLSDALREIQTSVFVDNPKRIKCIAVSSAASGEGKTLIAVGIASLLALDKTKKVVIVDADLRRPRIHHLFGHAEPGCGLASVSKGLGEDNSVTIHRHPGLEGLSYITSGPIPDDPVTVLQSEEARELFATLRTAYDFIVIDCPPILGLSDTRSVAPYTDGLVLVARQGVVARHALKDAVERVSAEYQTSLLGVVVNGAYAPGLSKYSIPYGGKYSYSSQYYRMAS